LALSCPVLALRSLDKSLALCYTTYEQIFIYNDMAIKKKERAVCEVSCEHPKTVRLAKKELIPARQAQQAAELFKALGDATRVKMLRVLADRELCVCDISVVIRMSQSAVSHQLRVLRGARLVKYRREGKMAWYSINDRHVAALLLQGIEHVRHP